jgi:hypothetical protein
VRRINGTHTQPVFVVVEQLDSRQPLWFESFGVAYVADSHTVLHTSTDPVAFARERDSLGASWMFSTRS